MNIPKDTLDFYNRANSIIQEGQFKEALPLLNNALEICPDYAEALILLSYIHYKFKLLSKEEVFKSNSYSIII